MQKEPSQKRKKTTQDNSQGGWHSVEHVIQTSRPAEYLFMPIAWNFGTFSMVQFWLLPSEKPVCKEDISYQQKTLIDAVYAHTNVVCISSPPFQPEQRDGEWKSFEDTEEFVIDESFLQDKTESLEFILYVLCFGKLLKKPPESHGKIHFRIVSAIQSPIFPLVF